MTNARRLVGILLLIGCADAIGPGAGQVDPTEVTAGSSPDTATDAPEAVTPTPSEDLVPGPLDVSAEDTTEITQPVDTAQPDADQPDTDQPDTDQPDTDQPTPDPGPPTPECGAVALATAGALKITLNGGITQIPFQTAQSLVAHRQDFANPSAQCITTVVLELSAGPGCTLTIEAGKQLDPDGNLIIQSVTLVAGAACPGLPPGASGTWTGSSQQNTLKLGQTHAPALADSPLCFGTSFVIQLEEPLTSNVGDSLQIGGSQLVVSGDVWSYGDAEAACPLDYVPPPEPDILGCSDGTREGFVDTIKYPKIAACGGAWDVPGIHNPTPVCNREGGNNGLNAPGVGCNVTDLCAPGWHVCLGKVDVLSRNPLGCGGIMDGAQSPAFFLARTSSVGAFNCSPDSTTFGNPGTSNDLFGCGDLGCSTANQKTLGQCASNGVGCDPLDPCPTCQPGVCADGSECTEGNCFPLTLGSHDLCKTLKVMPNCTCFTNPSGNVGCQPISGGCGWCHPLNYYNELLGLALQSTWDCGTQGSDEANHVTKGDPSTQGGVMCCADDAPSAP